MATELLVAAAAILVLGVGAQYLAWRLRVPGILLLLLVGFAAGPGSTLLPGRDTPLLDPDAMLGDLLQPIVALGVAVILFEGGLGLRLRDVRAHGLVVFRLVTVGVLVTWLIGSLAAYWFLGFDAPIALLLGAILVVSGPTVVLPLLRHVRANKSAATVLRWEGILIDPIGAMLAALVFEFVALGGGSETLPVVLRALFEVVIIGVALGALGAAIFIVFERRYWVPDFLASAFSLALVIAIFTAAETMHNEAGLFAVTAMGVILANQRWASVRHVIDFKEDLSLLLIGGLFVLLAARLPIEALQLLDWRAVAFLAVLILIARPLSVAASSWRSSLGWRERAFVAWMAPRGIVAAAVAALFAFRLDQAGYPEAQAFVPLTFLTIVGTVALYGLTARPVSRMLGVAEPEPQGVLIIGANPVGRALAVALKDHGFRALIADKDAQALTAARVQGLDAVRANVASVHLTDEVDLAGIGNLWAVTPSRETNSLAALHFAEEFGRARVCQIATSEEASPDPLQGRTLFGGMTYQTLRERLQGNEWTVRRTPLTAKFSYPEYQELYGDDAVPLFLIAPGKRLEVFATDSRPEPAPGKIIVALVREDQERDARAGEEE
jgi:NhaP-type Na+/H+ or K+/H+ antiporter